MTLPSYDILHESSEIAASAARAALRAALAEYAQALVRLEEVAKREPLWSLELNAVLKQTRAAQDEVSRGLTWVNQC
jgi:hypothetical protein